VPSVSVIVNAYDQVDYVAEAVDSVLAQTYDDFEVLLIDNGSTDGTGEVLSSYAADARVRVFRHERNEAITKRFNEGVRASRGEYICFLYSDDLYLPTKLARQVEVFERSGPDVGVVYGPPYWLNELTGERWVPGNVAAEGDVLERLLRDWRRGQIDMITPLTRRECFERYPFHEDLFAEGESIFLRIAMRWRFAYLDEPLTVIRDTGVNAGKAVQRNHDIAMTALDRLETHVDLPPSAAPAVRFYRRTLLRAYGWQAARLGADPAWARSRFAAAVRVSPRELLHPRTIAGYALTLLPSGARTRLNRVASRLRRSRGNDSYVADFQGDVF
jgi:glycosyltransferase involved in cell wall biosynthesis